MRLMIIQMKQFNSTCFLYERKIVDSNKKVSYYYPNIYSDGKSSNWTLVFANIPADDTYIYDLRLQIIASIMFDNSREEYMAFALKVDLTGIKKKGEEKPKEDDWYKWGIPVIVVGTILIIVLVFFVVKFLKLKNKNKNLQDEMVSLAFSNDIQKNVLIKDRNVSINESDYESTFI